MATTNDDDSTVSVKFTVKELLREIREDLREIRSLISTKADKTDLIALESRVTALESDDTADKAVTAYKKWLWPLIGGVSASLLLAIANIVLRLVHIGQ